MIGTREFCQLVFEGGYDARDEYETPRRGYRSHVAAELTDGTKYRVTFYDPGRIAQTLEDEAANGTPFFTEPGLIILPEVTRENMERAATELCRQGFFETLQPLKEKS